MACPTSRRPPDRCSSCACSRYRKHHARSHIAGSTLCRGLYPYTFGASFPAVAATTYTVRAYLDDQIVSEHTGHAGPD